MNHPNVQVTSPSDVTDRVIERTSPTVARDRVRQDPMLVPGVLIGILN
jgi:hypothetical protein